MSRVYSWLSILNLNLTENFLIRFISFSKMFRHLCADFLLKIEEKITIIIFSKLIVLLKNSGLADFKIFLKIVRNDHVLK